MTDLSRFLGFGAPVPMRSPDGVGSGVAPAAPAAPDALVLDHPLPAIVDQPIPPTQAPPAPPTQSEALPPTQSSALLPVLTRVELAGERFVGRIEADVVNEFHNLVQAHPLKGLLSAAVAVFDDHSAKLVNLTIELHAAVDRLGAPQTPAPAPAPDPVDRDTGGPVLSNMAFLNARLSRIVDQVEHALAKLTAAI